MSRLLIFLFLFTGFDLYAQENKTTFGEVPYEELAAKVFEIDSSAEAIKLYEKGETYFLFDGSGSMGYYMETKMHVRIKIIKTSGLRHGTVIIPYYQGDIGKEEVVSGLKGLTYNLNKGQVVKEELGSKSIFTEKVRDKYYHKKLSFQNVKEGSIIEYQYTIQTPLMVRDKPRTWYFQSEIPVLWSELNISIPPHFYYQIISGGYLPLHINEKSNVFIAMGHSRLDANGIKYRLVVKDAPAFKDEPFISTEDDYLSKIEFELSRIAIPGDVVKNLSVTWEDIDRSLLYSEYWGNKLKKNNFLEDQVKVLKLIPDMKERLDKAHAIMSSQMKWNGREGLYVIDDLKRVYENKTGSATEMNMLMLVLLREAGFQAHPVILSTRNNGMINPLFPLMDRFNYTLVMVELDGERIMIDITDELLKPGTVPEKCLTNTARVVKPKGGEMISITDKDKYRELQLFNIKLDAESGKMSGSYSSQSSGYLARNIRSRSIATGEEKFRKEIINQFKDLELKNLELKNFNDISSNTEIAFDFEKETENGEADVWYIEAMHFGKLWKNPFMKSDREFPVDFGHMTENTILGTYHIPDGYVVEELPKNMALVLPEGGGKFSFICKQDEGKIQIISKMNINKSFFPAEHYHLLKDFYDRIIKKHGEQIIIKKKI